MRTLAILLAGSVLATSALAQSTTVIHKEGVGGSSTVIKERSEEPTVVEKRVTSSSVGCSSKTVEKTDDFGDTKTKTKTTC